MSAERAATIGIVTKAHPNLAYLDDDTIIRLSNLESLGDVGLLGRVDGLLFMFEVGVRMVKGDLSFDEILTACENIIAEHREAE